MIPTLIFCGGGNRRYAKIAIEAGFLYGSRLPGTPYFPLYFADQDWKKPNRAAYMDNLKKYHPYMASVIDWIRDDQLNEVLDWAEEAALYVNELMIIPKVHGGIKHLPREIGGKKVRLGYSVPTRYGGTEVFVHEFRDWPVHLLGGSPIAQKRIAYYLNVVSMDGNMSMLMANRYCAYFDPTRRSYWPTLSQADGQKWHGDAPYEAFRRSCTNIISFWDNFKEAKR